MSGSRAERIRKPAPRGSRAASGGEWAGRAAKRTDWAGRALERAAEDLREAGARSGGFEGLTEIVLEQAGRVSRLAEDIDRRKDDLDGG